MSAKMRWLCGLSLIVATLGCSRGLPPEIDPNAAVPVQPGLQAGEVDLSTASEAIDLAALLNAPRADLAQQCDEIEKTIRRQEQFHLEGKLTYTLLPELKLPLVVPVFRDAAYNSDRGVSLPPYLKADAHDSAVAFHVAKFGDLDAAIKFIEPGDDAVAKLIRETAFEKHYPLEWTRLVALLMHKNQVAIATDQVDGAKNLIALHKQVRALLDEKAKQSPLGVALLTRGFGTLKQAAAAWKAGRRDDLDLQVQSFLASAGTPTAYSIRLPSNFEDLRQLFGQKGEGNALVNSKPSRIADLLNLYLPTDEADTCVAFWDDAKKVNQVMFTYRPLLFQFNTPEQFAQPMEDLLPGRNEELPGGCPRRAWDLAPGQLDVTLTPRHATLGGIVRIQVPGGASDVALSRDFGPVHLDRTFEMNRRLTAWHKRGNNLMLTDQAAASVTNPLRTRPLVDVLVDREPSHDLVNKITFEYGENSKDLLPAAGSIARPMLQTNGRPTLTFGEVGSGTVDFVWNDSKTRYCLRFPYSRERRIELDITDLSGADLNVRVKAAVEKDVADRRERIEKKKPLAVVPRQLDSIRLGMIKAEFSKAMLKSPQLVEREIPGGVMAAYLGSPKQGGDAVAREWFARFDHDKAVEIRVRYVDLPTNKPGTFAKKIDTFKSKIGAPEVTAANAEMWADLPKRGISQTMSWRDDVTLLTVRQEPYGLEVILRECPADHPEGTPLPPIEYLARGAGNVKLGMSKDELLKLGAQPHEGNAFLMDSAGKDAAGKDYDAVLAWLADGKVERIVARHKVASPMKVDTQASRMLLEQWARDSRSLGWPNRQDMAGPNLQSLASRDDHTRYRLFWTEEPHGVSVFSEWKDAK